MVGPSVQSDLTQKIHFLKKMLYFLVNRFVQSPMRPWYGRPEGNKPVGGNPVMESTSNWLYLYDNILP